MSRALRLFLLAPLLACAEPAPSPRPSSERSVPDTTEEPAEPATPATPAAPVFTPPTAEQSEAFAVANNGFAFRLFRELELDPRQNLAFSPVSLELALAMAAKGGEGKTRETIAGALGVEDWDLFQSSLLPIQNSWRASDAKFDIATRFYVDQRVDVIAGFADWSESTFGAPPEKLNLAGDSAAARERINGWVSEQTQRTIPELLPAEAINERTALVLANAMAFRAAWKHGFKEAVTQPGEFLAHGSEAVQVPMMRNWVKVPHARVEFGGKQGALEVVDMPYIGERFSMTIVMPADPAGLRVLEAGLDSELWAKLVGELELEKLELSLPRFKATTPGSLNLRSPLSGLGMELAFGDGADFSGITSSDIALEGVFHRSVVSVDEDGTVATAATAVTARTKKASKRPPVEVRIDRPFVFAIRDLETGAVLFLGRVVDPR